VKKLDPFYENWMKRRKRGAGRLRIRIAQAGEIPEYLLREKKHKEIEEEIEKKIEEDKKRKKRYMEAVYEELRESFPEYYQYLERNKKCGKKME
jgi:hypothetical protein